jgi:replicative DNA helicase
MTPPAADTLHNYGQAFQIKTLAALCTDKEFVEQSLDIISPKYFDSESSSWIVEVILEYFATYKSLPTLEVFKLESTKIKSEVLKISAVEMLKSVYQHKKDVDLTYTKDAFLKFCKNQQIKTAIIKSVDMLEREDYDGIKSVVDHALKAGGSRDLGHDYKKDLDIRTGESARTTIATPWAVLNGVMDGGLGPGELGTVMASAGAGKSWMLAAIGANALREGYVVSHLTISDLSQNYVGLRYDTIFAGIEPHLIQHNLEKVREVVAAVKGELKIKYYPARAINTNGIAAYLERMKMYNFVPDMVIVDYADHLRANDKADARYQELGYIYEDLRALAGEYNFPVWTASQSQRSSIQDDIIEADKVSGSYEKIMNADFVMSLSRKSNDKVMGTARVHIIKNRFGPDGLTFPMKMEIPTGKFEIYDEGSAIGIQLKQDMSNDTKLRKKLFEKFEETREHPSLD